MPKHTPGPWLIGKHGSIISDPGNNNEGNNNVIDFYGGNVVCESIQIAANAYLIAAAPELLEALEKIALGEGWQAVIANVVIKKAKGEITNAEIP